MIRAATPADVEAIRRIHNDAIRATPAFAGEETEKSLDERVAWLASHGTRYPVIVAEREGAVVGWGALAAWSTYESHAQSVEHSVYVDAAARGKGVGRAILVALLEAARALGYRTVIGRVASVNEASLALHAALGFRTVGVMRAVCRVRGADFDEVVLQVVF